MEQILRELVMEHLYIQLQMVKYQVLLEEILVEEIWFLFIPFNVICRGRVVRCTANYFGRPLHAHFHSFYSGK